jgi:hypothetical protein
MKPTYVYQPPKSDAWEGGLSELRRPRDRCPRCHHVHRPRLSCRCCAEEYGAPSRRRRQ